MSDISENDGPFGVYFTTSSSKIDEEEVKRDFAHYGKIVYVKQNLSRVYVNFKQKTDAENCLRTSPDSKYGEIKRGKFVTSALNNFQKDNLSGRRDTDNFCKADRFEKKPRSSLVSSQFPNSGSHQMNNRNRDNNSYGNCSRDDDDDDDDDDWFEKSDVRSRNSGSHQMNDRNRGNCSREDDDWVEKRDVRSRNRNNSHESRDTDNFSKNADKFEKKPNSPTSSQFHSPGSGRNGDNNASDYRSREGDDWLENKTARSAKAGNIDKRKNNRRSHYSPRQETASCKNTNSQAVRNSLPNKNVSNEFMQNSRDSPPPLLSYEDHPPPLLSVDDCPPPLISVNCTPPTSPPTKVPTHKAHSQSGRPGILPTPPLSMRLDYNPNSCSHLASSPKPNQSPTSVSQRSPDIPPPLVSANSQTSSNGFKPLRNSSSCNDYVNKYGNYVIIANLPEGTTSDEMEKVLYPHIPLSVSAPEVTNIKMKILFCLATFNSQSEAAKAAKKLDEVELRGHCLTMIRLDELASFNSVPF